MIVRRTHVINNARAIWHVPSRKHLSSNSSSVAKPTTDELGLPLSPSWSVYGLINSYPSPTLSNATLTRLHDLAALKSPPEDSSRFQDLKQEMEDLVRLVEAVRIAPIEVEDGNGPPDGRVWAKGRGIVLEDTMKNEEERRPSGRELLEHASRSKDGYYLVDSTKTKI